MSILIKNKLYTNQNILFGYKNISKLMLNDLPKSAQCKKIFVILSNMYLYESRGELQYLGSIAILITTRGTRTLTSGL